MSDPYIKNMIRIQIKGGEPRILNSREQMREHKTIYLKRQRERDPMRLFSTTTTSNISSKKNIS